MKKSRRGRERENLRAERRRGDISSKVPPWRAGSKLNRVSHKPLSPAVAGQLPLSGEQNSLTPRPEKGEGPGRGFTKIISAVLMLLLFAGVAGASDIMDIGPGARSISLGKTYTSVNADPYGILGNPASLRGVATGEIISMYGQLTSDIIYTLQGYVMPTKNGKFFGSYANNQILGFTSTTVDAHGRPVPVTNFDFTNNLFMFGYENSLNKAVSYGLRLKYYNEGSADIGGLSGSGINADAGLLVKANEKLTLGMTAKNIIPGLGMNINKGPVEELPFVLDMGLAFSPDKKLDIFSDVSLTKNIPAEIKLGVEWRLIKSLALRCGAEQRSLGSTSSYINGSAGVGFNVGIFAIDYAYYYDSLLSANSRHFISISIETPAVKAAEPVFADKK